MPPKKVPLPRSPLGQAPIEDRTYEESFDLLAASPSSEQYLTLSTSKYEVSPSGRNFKVHTPNTPSPRIPPLPPSRKPMMKRQQNDPEALPLFASNSEQSHRSFGRMDSGGMKDMEMEDMDYYLPPKRQCPRECRCVFATLLFLLFSVALVLSGLYLAARPRSPTLEMKVLNITSFKFDEGLNAGASQIAAGLKFSLEEANPNREAELIYDLVRIELKYQGSLLGNISIPGFKQRKKSNRTLVLEMPKTLTAVTDPDEAQNFRKDMSRFNVQTDLKGAVAGHYKMWGMRVKKFDVPVDCKLNVEPENGGRPAKLLSSSCYYYPT